jgi:HEAT repeat protein
VAVNGEYVRLTFSRAGLLAFSSLLGGTAAVWSQTNQGEIKKHENLPRNTIQEKVRRNLADSLDDEDAIKDLFALGDQAVPSLIKFLSDPDKGTRAGAARGLAYIGNQQGMQALRSAAKTERDRETKSAISCFLAGGLVETKSEDDLHFLRSSVERARFADDDEKDFPAFCAALALGMMGRSDSLPILRKAAGADLLDSEEIGKAILWMENKSASGHATTGPASSDEELIKRFVLDSTFFSEKERDKTSVEQLTFNRARDKVLVSLEIYLSPKSARGCDLVLVKESGVWRVVGIWFAWIA